MLTNAFKRAIMLSQDNGFWLFFVLKLLSFKISEQKAGVMNRQRAARISRDTFNGRRYRNVYNCGSTPQSAANMVVRPFGRVVSTRGGF